MKQDKYGPLCGKFVKKCGPCAIPLRLNVSYMQKYETLMQTGAPTLKCRVLMYDSLITNCTCTKYVFMIF